MYAHHYKKQSGRHYMKKTKQKIFVCARKRILKQTLTYATQKSSRYQRILKPISNAKCYHMYLMHGLMKIKHESVMKFPLHVISMNIRNLDHQQKSKQKFKSLKKAS